MKETPLTQSKIFHFQTGKGKERIKIVDPLSCKLRMKAFEKFLVEQNYITSATRIAQEKDANTIYV